MRNANVKRYKNNENEVHGQCIGHVLDNRVCFFI